MTKPKVVRRSNGQHAEPDATLTDFAAGVEATLSTSHRDFSVG